MVRPDLTDDMPIRLGTNKEMAKLAGQTVTITHINFVEGFYHIAKDNETWKWTDEMLTDIRPQISLLDLIESMRIIPSSIQDGK